MFMSTITLKSRISNNNMYYQPMKKSHIHLKSSRISITILIVVTQKVGSYQFWN
jgi:hypothetical protein